MLVGAREATKRARTQSEANLAALQASELSLPLSLVCVYSVTRPGSGCARTVLKAALNRQVEWRAQSCCRPLRLASVRMNRALGSAWDE